VALIRIFGGEGLTSLSYVKMCADSKKHSLIDPTHAILATFWPKIEIFIIFGQKSDFHQKFCCDQPILCKKMC